MRQATPMQIQAVYDCAKNQSRCWSAQIVLNCAGAGATGLVSHFMVVGGRSPNKILFARGSGRVWQLDFYPTVCLHWTNCALMSIAVSAQHTVLL